MTGVEVQTDGNHPPSAGARAIAKSSPSCQGEGVIGHLADIHVYPVKGCRGIRVERAELTPRGLRHDRRWMVADHAGRFVSQRERKDLALVRTSFLGDHLVLERSGHPVQHVPLELTEGAAREVTIWQDPVAALEFAPGSAWFSRVLGEQVSLVYMPETTERQVDLRFAQPGDLVSFADGYPLLVIGEASLADLNRRLGQPITMERFRPNLVFAGTPPYAEERLARFSVADIPMRGVKPCARCVVTTIDPDTAAAGKEPLATLATYKRDGAGKVIFGMNVIHEATGTLALGAPVTMSEALTVSDP